MNPDIRVCIDIEGSDGHDFTANVRTLFGAEYNTAEKEIAKMANLNAFQSDFLEPIAAANAFHPSTMRLFNTMIGLSCEFGNLESKPVAAVFSFDADLHKKIDEKAHQEGYTFEQAAQELDEKPEDYRYGKRWIVMSCQPIA